MKTVTKKAFKKMTLNEKINFRSHFKVENCDSWFMRIARPYYHYSSVSNMLDENKKPLFTYGGNRTDMPFLAFGKANQLRFKLLY